MRHQTTSAYTLAALALAGCANAPPEMLDEGEEFIEDGVVVEDGKADDFLSLTAREFVITGTDQVVLEPEHASRTSAQRMTRARQLVSLRQIALAWFLNQYLVDKESDQANHTYGGFGAMAKAGDYESLRIREVAPLTYAFDFSHLIAGRSDLMTRLPTRPGAIAGQRVLTLSVGLPTNAEMARLDTNSEWYRSAPWSEWNPTTVSAAQRRDLTVTIRPETESRDAWFDYEGLFADGRLDIDVHFGWDYHAAYHVTHARSFYNWLRARGFSSPVASFDRYDRTSGPLTRTIRANGRTITVEVRIFYGHEDGGTTDPDTAAGGRQLEEDMRASLATRDVIVYSGHSGPFYGFALANWRMTDEGDLDDSEMSTVTMASRSQIVFAEGCDTYQIGAAFGRNPAHPDLRGLDVITTTSFSNASSSTPVQNFVSRLVERDSRGRHRPRTVRSLLQDLDAGTGYGFHTMYGIHGIDDDPRVHPYAEREMFGEMCAANADCGDIGNLCIRQLDGVRRCTAACTSDDGCGAGYRCRLVASASATAIYGSACVPR
jgi:hypothetical protein